jgi:hypothetical protein
MPFALEPDVVIIPEFVKALSLPTASMPTELSPFVVMVPSFVTMFPVEPVKSRIPCESSPLVTIVPVLRTTLLSPPSENMPSDRSPFVVIVPVGDRVIAVKADAVERVAGDCDAALVGDLALVPNEDTVDIRDVERSPRLDDNGHIGAAGRRFNSRGVRIGCGSITGYGLAGCRVMVIARGKRGPSPEKGYGQTGRGEQAQSA